MSLTNHERKMLKSIVEDNPNSHRFLYKSKFFNKSGWIIYFHNQPKYKALGCNIMGPLNLFYNRIDPETMKKFIKMKLVRFLPNSTIKYKLSCEKVAMININKLKEGEIHINYVKTHKREISRGICPDCGKWACFVHFFQKWYGWDTICLRCGRRWCDDEWMPLTFSRTARRDSIESAKKRWRRKLDKGE